MKDRRINIKKRSENMKNFGLLKINNLSLNEDLTAVINIYKSAMSSEPWFEKLSTKIIKTRIFSDFSKSNSEQYIA